MKCICVKKIKYRYNLVITQLVNTHCLLFSLLETKLKQGGAATMRELYVHLHSRNAEGKSLVLEKYKSSQVEAASEANEHDDDNVSLQPTTEETGAETETFDITSLKFTTPRAEKVLVSFNLYHP